MVRIPTDARIGNEQRLSVWPLSVWAISVRTPLKGCSWRTPTVCENNLALAHDVGIGLSKALFEFTFDGSSSPSPELLATHW